MPDDDPDLIKFLEQRVYDGLRGVEDINFDRLPDGEDLPPAVMLTSGPITVVMVPTVGDGVLDLELHAFIAGAEVDQSSFYTVRAEVIAP